MGALSNVNLFKSSCTTRGRATYKAIELERINNNVRYGIVASACKAHCPTAGHWSLIGVGVAHVGRVSTSKVLLWNARVALR